MQEIIEINPIDVVPSLLPTSGLPDYAVQAGRAGRESTPGSTVLENS